ncbi:molybdenum cofactor guanylyltransferase [Haloferax sp. S1W]|uniref:molybdenum cofactor guanylyltransferase n=1 Tax=Haloferax sp. S1W TaxID=3377110 RepID=UPI0037C63AEB
MTDGSPTKPDTGRTGIILAGGRSTRFGTMDKATATLDGCPMISRVADALDPIVDELVVNCRAEQRTGLTAALLDFDVRFAEDSYPDCGPVFGLRTALRESRGVYAAVLPCDMPFVPSGFLSHLFNRLGGRPGIVPTGSDGMIPVPAVVHTRAAVSACTEALRSGDDSLHGVMSHLDVAVLDEREVTAHAGKRAFHNVNTLDDLRAAASSR